MADHPALYGLMSSLPALSLEEPVEVQHPVWQLAIDWLQPAELTWLAALYAPAQWSNFLGSVINPTALPAPEAWRNYAANFQPAEMPYRQALREERAAWRQWLLNQPLPMLHQWLSLQEQLENQRFEQVAQLHPWAQSMRKQTPSLEATDHAWPATDWSLWQHATELYEQEYRTDQLLWHWLNEQVFYRPFTFDALLSYALRQQMQHRWFVLAQAETTSLLENIIHESLA